MISEVNNKETKEALFIFELLKENLDLCKEEDDGEDNAIEDLWAITLPSLKTELYVQMFYLYLNSNNIGRY